MIIFDNILIFKICFQIININVNIKSKTIFLSKYRVNCDDQEFGKRVSRWNTDDNKLETRCKSLEHAKEVF